LTTSVILINLPPKSIKNFDDLREIQTHLKEKGVKLEHEVNNNASSSALMYPEEYRKH